MAIVNFDEFVREYDADNVYLHPGWEIYVKRTCQHMDWKWPYEQNIVLYLFALLFGARKKSWFMRQCRNSETGFYTAIAKQVDFMKKSPSELESESKDEF